MSSSEVKENKVGIGKVKGGYMRSRGGIWGQVGYMRSRGVYEVKGGI